MSKIICDICGTTYQDTAECCPICGCSRDAAAALLGENQIFEDTAFTDSRGKGSSAAASPRKKKEIFDFDEVNPDPEDLLREDEAPYDEDEEEPMEYAEPPRHNTFAVIGLTVLIVALLGAAAFLLVRYYLPNMGQQEEQMHETTPTQAQETFPATTEFSIPCTNLVLTSGSAELTTEGNYHLLNVTALPENTTDKIIYTSADESIATVSENGRITAVSEGETVIYITCGSIQQTCTVTCRFTGPTTAPTETAAQEQTQPPVEETAPAVSPETTPETTAPTSNPDVVLKLEKTDIMLGVYYEFQLKLDCDLEQNQVTWTSEHPHIATVDENGVVKALKAGTTSIKATYGDQEVSCIVRCG